MEIRSGFTAGDQDERRSLPSEWTSVEIRELRKLGDSLENFSNAREMNSNADLFVHSSGKDQTRTRDEVVVGGRIHFKGRITTSNTHTQLHQRHDHHPDLLSQ